MLQKIGEEIGRKHKPHPILSVIGQTQKQFFVEYF
jgi:hypothetical protein